MFSMFQILSGIILFKWRIPASSYVAEIPDGGAAFLPIFNAGIREPGSKVPPFSIRGTLYHARKRKPAGAGFRQG